MRKQFSRGNEKNTFLVEVEGHQIFTADYVFEQMNAQSQRICTANKISKFAIVLSVISLTMTILQALL